MYNFIDSFIFLQTRWPLGVAQYILGEAPPRATPVVAPMLVIYITFLNLHIQTNETLIKLMGTLVWETNSNTRLSYFIRGLQTLENNKNLEATPTGFHYLLMFGISDETLRPCLNYYVKHT